MAHMKHIDLKGGPVDDRQRAEDNDRLRRLAAEELAAIRTELTRALQERVELHQDLNALAERLSEQENRTAEVQSELDGTKAELAEARAELAAVPPSGPPPPPAQKKRSWTRVLPKPARSFARKALRAARSGW